MLLKALAPASIAPAAIEGSFMIIQDQGDQLVLIRQTDHALLSGFFARQWGNDLFTRPEPFESFCLAAAEHDNGWREWELLPSIDPVTFSPYSFMSVSTQEHIALYQCGLDRLIKADHYAGLLACLHCEQLYDHTRATIPGYSAKYVKSSEMNPVNAFMERLRLQELRLRVDLRSQPDKKHFADDKLLFANTQRLEALDRLSLYFCMASREVAIIEAVPVDNEGSEADWIISPGEAANSFTLSPFPFRRDPIEFTILARYIPKRRYSDDPELQKALARAPYSLLKFTLRSADARASSFSASA
jgi:hypothetical protein